MVVDSDADTDSVYEVEYERQSHLITLDEIYKLAKKISEDFDEFSKNPSSKKAESLKWNIITALEQSERLIAAFQKLEEEKQALQDLSSQQNMDNRRLAETLKTLEQFVEEMEESEELMKEELRSLLADCEKQKQENERLKTLISEESAPLVDEQVGSFCSDEENFAKETLSQLKETNRALRQQLALCETELEEEKDKNEELTDFADDIESFAKTLKTKCHKLESEVMQLTSERDNLSIKLDEEGAKLKQLQKINVQVSAKARSTTFGPLRNQTPLCEEFTAEDVYINGSGPDALKGPRTRPDEQFEDVFEVSQSGISQEESSYVKMVQEFEKFSDLQSFCVEKISKPVTSQYHVSNRYSIQEMTTSCEKLTEKLNALDTADITKEFTEFLADERLDESARSNVLTVVTGFIGNSTYSVFEESFPVLATSLMQTYQLGRETNLGMESGLQTQTSVDFSPMSGELNLLDELNKAIASDSLEENEFLLRPHLSTLKEEPSVEIEDMGTDEEGDVPKDEATNLSETPDAKTTEVSEPTTANEETSTSENKSIIEQQSEDANGDSANDVQSTKLLIPDDNEMRAARGLRSATMSSVESADTESGSVGVGEVTVSKMKMSRQASRETRYRVNYSKSISHRRKTVMEGLREEKSVDGEMGDIVGKGIVHQTTADIVQESDLRKQKRSDFYKQQDVQVKTDKPIDLSALGEKRQQVMDEKYTEDGFLKIDPKDPNRPRYTKAELLQVIREKADLNLQKMYLEEELELVKEQLKQLQQSHTQTQKRLAQANERRSIRKLFGIFRHRHSHPNANNLAMSSGKASYSASADFSDAKLPAQRRPSCDSVTFDTTGAVSSNGKHSRSVRPPSWVTRTGPKYDNRESSVTLVVPSSPPPPRDTEF